MIRIESAMAIAPDVQEESFEILLRGYLTLCQWLGCSLSVLTTDEAVAKLSDLVKKQGFRTEKVISVYGGLRKNPDKLLDQVATMSPNLVIAETAWITGTTWLETFLEKLTVPVVLLPKEARISEISSIDRLVVAMSGEKRVCDALEFALKVADQTRSPVDLLHVTEAEEACSCGAQQLESLPDQPQHEYPQMLDRLVSEGSPFSRRHERKWVRELCHCSGNTVNEVTQFVEKRPRSVLVLEWKGSLRSGRAETLKGILRSVTHPVFLVRTDARFRSRLKVAGEFEAA